MNFIQTKSFNLAVYQKGDINSSKLALILPGQLDTKDYPHMRSHVEYLANRGYLALSFDPAGTWESPGEYTFYTMTNYLKEVNELIEYFGNKKTLVFGHSRGGSMAMLAAIKNPSVIAFGAIMSYYSFKTLQVKGLNDDEEWKKNGYKIKKRDLPKDIHKIKEFKLPYVFLEDQQQYDMTRDLALCKKPKMFVVGAQDKILNPEDVKKGFELSASPKKLYILESGHDYRYETSLIEKVNGFIGEFINSYL